jgi:hypothetical protein
VESVQEIDDARVIARHHRSNCGREEREKFRSVIRNQVREIAHVIAAGVRVPERR